MKEILGLTLQLEEFMFITMVTGLNQLLTILALRVQRVQLALKVQLLLLLDLRVQSGQQVRLVLREIQDRLDHKVYM
jgi:hypothetical protein